MVTGQAISGWVAVGSPDPPSVVYWRVWIIFIFAIGCFVASHYTRKQLEEEESEGCPNGKERDC